MLSILTQNKDIIYYKPNAGTRGFFKDDKNIVQLNLSKIWTWHPGVMIEIKKVGEE